MVQEEFKPIINKLKENRESLRISRVPPKTKANFIKLADDEFCGDYGMVLKFLMDGIIAEDTKILLDRVNEIDARLNTVEACLDSLKVQEEESKTITMVDGTKRRFKR